MTVDILKKPIINEKFAKLNEQGDYGFVVAKKANKIEIRKAVEKLYGVNVTKVRTINVLGRVKNRITKGRFITGSTQSYKTAIFTLTKGDLIDYFGDI
jgi:large subunit ribosomal protein L23